MSKFRELIESQMTAIERQTYDKLLIIDPDKWNSMSLEMRDIFLDIAYESAQMSCSIYVYYHNSCCDYDQRVLLDRLPLSEKIICGCKCGKGTVVELIKPLEFHCPIMKEDYTLEQLKNDFYLDPNSRQYPILSALKNS